MFRLRRAQFLAVFLAVYFSGCPARPKVEPQIATESTRSPTTKTEGPLRILVLDDIELATVLKREWEALSENAVEVTNLDSPTMLSRLDGGMRKLESDVFIFPSWMLGQLAEQKLLRPLPRELEREAEYRYPEILNLIRRRETKWGQQTQAVSFGSPALLLLRRTDFVPDAPETWHALNRKVEELRDSLPKEMTPLVQPLGDGWASRMLMARAAAYFYDSSRVSSVFEYSTMQPRIATAPFVRALEELVADARGGRDNLTPASALEEFIQGRAAMVITWPSAISTPPAGETVAFPVAISDLPGTDEKYSDKEEAWRKLPEGSIRRATLFGSAGRLGAVSRSAKNAALANIFLAWATGPEASSKLSPRSQHTAPFRASHTSSEWIDQRLPNEVAPQYVAAVSQALNRSAAFQYPRLPGQHEYMKNLDRAVLATLRREVGPVAALGQVSESWNDITSELDKQKQTMSYRRSLGINTE